MAADRGTPPTRSAAAKVVETIAGERCPCGHLKQRHRKGEGDGIPLPGFSEKLGECRDCECRGLLEMPEETTS